MESNGLDPFKYWFICYDEWDDEFKTIPGSPAKDSWIEKIYYKDADGNLLQQKPMYCLI